MRSLILVSALAAVLGACSSDPAGSAPPASVRDLLADQGATLAVSSASTGAINARLWRTGWEDDVVALAIGAGELVLSTDAAGGLVVEDLSFAIAPIELSRDVFPEPSRLVDLRVELAADAPTAATTWTDADTAVAATTASLRLSWSLDVDGRVSPLGPVMLTGLPVELTVSGDAAHVQAGLAVAVAGRVWSWAGLIELADLSLSLTASSTPE